MTTRVTEPADEPIHIAPYDSEWPAQFNHERDLLHRAIAYFEAVAQIIPIVILALAIELRYFSPARQPPGTLGLLFRDPARARVVAAIYAAATLLALVFSEAVALWALAGDETAR